MRCWPLDVKHEILNWDISSILFNDRTELSFPSTKERKYHSCNIKLRKPEPQSKNIQILFSSVVLYVLQTCAFKGDLTRGSSADWMSRVFCCASTCVDTGIVYHGKHNEAITVITEGENDSSLEWRYLPFCEINPS